jgi:hypothetical protein
MTQRGLKRDKTSVEAKTNAAIQPAGLRYKSGPKPDIHRDAIKARYLETMSKTYNVGWSATAAGIDRRTILNWRNEGYITQDDEQQAYDAFCDYIGAEVVKLGLLGTEEPLISNGRVVHDQAGNVVYHHVIDKRLLARLADRHLPGFKTTSQQEITVHRDDHGIPAQYLLTIDSRDLTPDQWSRVKAVADEVQESKRLQREEALAGGQAGVIEAE